MGTRALLHRFDREDQGQTLLFLALMLAVLLGFTGMVVDDGVVYWNRRMLQNAVDAAALAGANQLPANPAAALQAAVTYAQVNGVAPSELICVPPPSQPAPNVDYPASVTCQAGTDATFGVQITQTYSPDDTMIVSARRTISFGLRYLIGAGSTPVVATAAAIVSVQNPGDIAPVAVSIQQVDTAASSGGTPTPCTNAYTECTIKVGAGSGNAGNFQEIAWDKATPGAGACPGGGNVCVQYSWTNGYPGPIATPVTVVPGPSGTPVPEWDWNVPTQTGAMADVSKPMTQIAQWDQAQECDGGTPCPGLYVTPLPTLTSSGVSFYPDTTDSSGNGVVCYQYVDCPRVVVIPFISQSWTASNGQTMVTITSFGCFYITRTVPGSGQGQLDIDGMFIPTCKSTTGLAWYGIPLTPGGILGNDIGIYLWR